jgi:fatty acid-binding protein DegV
MINDFLKSHNIDPESVLVVGAPSVDDNYKEVIYNLLKENGVKEARWMRAGAVISSHGGPGAIGITGIEKYKD